jgi:hypothetical protein
MQHFLTLPRTERRIATLAGLLYGTVIVTGISAEFGLRQALITPGDAVATANALAAAPGLHRLSLMADGIMLLCDVALALLLFVLFRAVSPVLAMSAMVLRLLQAVLIAVALLASHSAGKLALAGADPAWVLWLTEMHAEGYDLGLVFFGVNAWVMATLLWQAGAARGLSVLIALTGAVYVGGSAVRFLAPELMDTVTPAYLVAIVAETWFCGWLLWQGLRPVGRVNLAAALPAAA